MENVILSKTTLLNVVLRIPALFMADIWLRQDFYPTLVREARRGYGQISHSHWDRFGEYFTDVMCHGIYYIGLLFAVCLLLLPLKRLAPIYIMVLSSFLVFISSIVSDAYVNRVTQSKLSLTKDGLYVVVQGTLFAIIHYLLEDKQYSYIITVHLLPVVTKVCISPEALQNIQNITANVVLFSFTLYILSHIPKVISSVMHELQVLHAQGQVLGWLVAFFGICSKHKFTLQLFLFWWLLFLHKVYTLLAAGKIEEMKSSGFLLSFMICAAECCRSPVSMLGMSAAVSYASMMILAGTKWLLHSGQEQIPETVVLDGWVEGLTMCLLAIQTGLTSLKTAHRAVVLSIVLFVVLTSLIQSLYELCDPILLNLCASQNKNWKKHGKTLFVFTILWMLPIIMTVYVLKWFQVDFWLLVIVSSALLTTVQVLGSLLIYGLFLYDMLSSNTIENMDDLVYYIKCTIRVLEFIVALGVVLHGIYGSVFGEWSWFNSSVIIIHGYFNVWKRLQSGWKTYLLRRQATQKLDSLPRATEEQLAEHHDVCAICYQEMRSAHITECGHFFHATCLRKWLYVQDFCPMCHQKI